MQQIFEFMDDRVRVMREKATVKKMISLYCHSHHSNSGSQLCDSCQTIYEYASKRIDVCVFGNDKPTCENCPVHCYNKEMKAKIKTIMRFSGPRMIYRQPIAAVNHFIDKAIDKKKIKRHYKSTKKRTI